MAGEHEPAKMLLPYLQRADELQQHEPLVAYYCRLYAMDLGMKIPQSQRTKTTNALLSSLIKQLEKDKKSLNLGREDNLHLEGFALGVFAKADKQDRAGRADLNTAKTFYAASIFFEIINQFGPLQPDIEQKQKYAAWKAADIRKALKEGRTPVPGPPAGDDDLSLPSVTTPNETLSLGTNLGAEADSSPQIHERQHSANISGSPSGSLPSPSYPSHDFHQSPPPPPSLTKSDSLVYSHHLPQNYPSEHLPGGNYPSEQMPQAPQNNYPSEPPQQHPPFNNYYHSLDNENPLYTYPNFQSYPSFNDSTLPSVPTHDPSYYQGSESSYSSPSASVVPPLYVSEVSQAAAPKMYQYDSNYQPPPELIAEAHKAARFAVGALAFDEVHVAVEHLRKSLELLMNPSAGQ